MTTTPHFRKTCLTAALAFLAAGCALGHTPEAGAADTIYDLAGERFTVETVAGGFRVPWALAWTPEGRLLVTERPGRLSVVEPGAKEARPLADVPDVDHAGEHGLMGIALSPAFKDDRLLYVSYTARTAAEGKLQNIIARFRLADDKLTDRKILIDGLPAADYHDGLPLRFGKDGKLYASTGDATQRTLAPRMDSLAGKFLRMNPDGTVPADNPFPGSLIWSLGHRNCQGFDWDPASGLVWATEHGPSFPLDGPGGHDEVNVVEKGKNYGWPQVIGSATAPGCTPPALHSGSGTWAPGGGCFYTGEKFPAWKGAFFFAGLRGEALYMTRPSAGDPRRAEPLVPVLHRQFGRLRAVAQGPDGFLYVTTSNRDTRGKPAPDDDRVLRLVPASGGAVK